MSSDDQELDAINAVARALDGLSRGQALRVIEWAQARYVDEKSLSTADHTSYLQNMTAAMEAVTRKAREDRVSPTLVWKTVARIIDQAGEQEQSTEGDGTSPGEET